MFCLLYNFVKKSNKFFPQCSTCENQGNCAKELGMRLRSINRANTVINRFPDGSIEVIKYAKDFEYLLEEINRPDVKRERKFELDENGILISKNGNNVTFDEMENCVSKSTNRSLDNFFGYGYSNKWDYFLTLTFDKDIVGDRYDDEKIKSCWSEFLRQIKRDNPEAKALVVPERHKDGALHFHGFLSDVNITLKMAFYPNDYRIKNKRGTQIYTKFGDPVFNIVNWTYGYSTVAILPPDVNTKKVVNYCLKYMKKTDNIGYNKKRYYRTYNLIFKEKELQLFEDYELFKIIKDNDLDLIKDNEKLQIFRQKTKG